MILLKKIYNVPTNYTISYPLLDVDDLDWAVIDCNEDTDNIIDCNGNTSDIIECGSSNESNKVLLHFKKRGADNYFNVKASIIETNKRYTVVNFTIDMNDIYGEWYMYVYSGENIENKTIVRFVETFNEYSNNEQNRVIKQYEK